MSILRRLLAATFAGVLAHASLAGTAEAAGVQPVLTVPEGGTSGHDPASARAGIGAAALTDIGTTAFQATGANSSSSAAARATFGGVKFDVRSNFGLACDGVTNDSAKFSSLVTAVNAMPGPTTLVFPGVCIIDLAQYTFTKNMQFEGTAIGYGLKLRVASSAMTTDILHFNAASGRIIFKDFTFDANSASSSTAIVQVIYTGPGVGIVYDHSQVLNTGAVVGSSAALIDIGSYGASSCKIVDSTFTSTLVQNTHARALNIGGIVNPAQDCEVSNNLVINNGFAFTCIGRLFVHNNDISGWGYGAAIGTNSGCTGEQPGVISDNIAHDSGTVPDTTGDKISAIETWQDNITVANNLAWNTCGAVYTFGGKTTVIGNRGHDPNTCGQSDPYFASVFATITYTTYSGSYSTFTGNKAYDTTGRTLYGYSDSPAITGVVLNNNDFNGVLGAYNITAGTQFAHPVMDNRLVNGCFNFNQRLEGAVQDQTGFVADQWRALATNNHGFTSLSTTTAQVGACQKSVLWNVVATRTSAATDFAAMYQNITFNDLQDLTWGFTKPKDLILAFCVKNINLTPPYVGSYFLQELAGTAKSYVGTYTILVAAGQQQCFSFRIPAGSTFLRNLTGGTTSALAVGLDFGSGSNNLTSSLNQWVTGSFYGSATQTAFNGLANGSQIELSDFALYPAAADVGHVPMIYTKDFENVRRFYRKSFPQGTTPAQNAGATGQVCAGNSIANGQPSLTIGFGSPMVNAPTITTFNPSAANASWRDTTTSSDVAASVPAAANSVNGFTIQSGAPVSAVNDLLCLHYVADGGV